MGAMKRYAETVSVDLGFDGEINDEVMAEAQRRLDAAEVRRNVRERDDEDRRV